MPVDHSVYKSREKVERPYVGKSTYIRLLSDDSGDINS